MPENEFTDKELQVIAEFDRARPGLGEIVARDIANPWGGYREMIANTPVEELKLKRQEDSHE